MGHKGHVDARAVYASTGVPSPEEIQHFLRTLLNASAPRLEGCQLNLRNEMTQSGMRYKKIGMLWKCFGMGRSAIEMHCASDSDWLPSWRISEFN